MRIRHGAGESALTVLAGAGAICIVLVVAAFVAKVTIIMFATGSMSPTIPAGSIAFVREIPATEITLGDVVTVDRGAELPITHRVIAIDDVDGSAVTFRMQGDDNESPDPYPYTATTVQRVLWSIPGVARVIVWFQDPLVLGGLSLALAALVTWAFWPREPKGQAPPQHAA